MDRILFIFNIGREEFINEALCGLIPTDFYYGAVEIKRLNFHVDLIEIDLKRSPNFFSRLIMLAARMGLLPEKFDGVCLEQIMRKKYLLRDYDCIVATTSGIAFALAALKSIGYFCPPIVGIHCGLFNNPYSFPKKLLTSFLLRKMTNIIFGDSELSSLKCISPDAKISVVQFGVDLSFWVPIYCNDICYDSYVVAVGNDGRRDYTTLISAVNNTEISCRILTKRALLYPLPINVEHIHGGWHSGGISDLELRNLYQRAFCVVVPLHESLQPSGQSVTLQAMACGKPVILTRTKGLWSETMMRDGENVIFVPAGDAEALRKAIQMVLNDAEFAKRLGSEARLTVERYGNIFSFAEGVVDACRDALVRKNCQVP